VSREQRDDVIIYTGLRDEKRNENFTFACETLRLFLCFTNTNMYPSRLPVQSIVNKIIILTLTPKYNIFALLNINCSIILKYPWACIYF